MRRLACLQALQRAAFFFFCDSLQRAAELGVQRLILDPGEHIRCGTRAAASSPLDCSSACGLIWELKDLLFSNFVSSTISHDPRLCNSVAHGLASLGAGLRSSPTSVRDIIPSCIPGRQRFGTV